MELIYGDCLQEMKNIPDASVDMILCDLPYGVLNKSNSRAKWDCCIDLEKLWKTYKRIAKDNATVVLFGQGMFTARLMISNEKDWRYNLIWQKGKSVTGFLNANRQPLRNHEDIVVFQSNPKLAIYNPQMEKSEIHHRGRDPYPHKNGCWGNFRDIGRTFSNEKFPRSIISFQRDEGKARHHPTQKPVPLLEWLIRTYTTRHMLVLDNCMGCGSTGIACLNTERDFIEIEIDSGYYNIAKQRMQEAIA